jgi:ferritin-like metal-binding protein YciE
MATLVNLRNLLEHEIEDLYSAEEQIIEALPIMATNATDRQLKNSLREHLKVTKEQKRRLDQVRKLLKKGSNAEEESGGFLARLFGGGSTKCKGMEGLIDEGNKVMGEEMESTVRDAAILASCQKIEHYEIAGYGTARAYAKELGLREVERLLAATLKEEHTADKILNILALNRVNLKAEVGGNTRRVPVKKAATKKSAAKKVATKKASGSRAR